MTPRFPFPATALVVALVSTLVLAVLVPLFASSFMVTLLNYVFLNAIVVVGLVMLTGILGLISFGQAAFVGVGAYASGWLSVTLSLSPWLGLCCALAVTATLAWALGLITLRMGGHYLAIATLAWGISFYYLFGNLGFLGGFTGLGNIPAPSLGPWKLDTERAMYGLILAGLVASLWVCANLLDSRVGRAMRSVKVGVALPESFGIDVAALKRFVFVLAATLAALSGWLYAHLQGYINPSPFGVTASIEYLFMAVIGGAAQLGGALLGAALVTLLREWLQDLMTLLTGRAGNFEVVVFGLLMLLVLNRAKQGLWPWLARWRPARPARHVPEARPLPPVRRAARAPAPLLQVEHVRRTFGGLVAVKAMSFDVQAGEIVGLIGPNGAGKSTMFNLISGILPLTAGQVHFAGQRIDGLPSREIAARGLARSFQHVKIVRSMTLLENVALGAWLRGGCGPLRSALRLNRAEEQATFADALWQLERVGLAPLKDALAGSLPLGKQRLLEIARALALDPALLLLDEPAAGLRAMEKRDLAQLLVQLRQQGMAVLLVEHDMEFVMQLADKLVVMNFGEKLASGTPQQVQADPRVLEAYLGSEE